MVNKKLHAIFLAFLAPGLLLSWMLIIFPFHLWDSIKDDWYWEFKNDLKVYFKGIKELWNGNS